MVLPQSNNRYSALRGGNPKSFLLNYDMGILTTTPRLSKVGLVQVFDISKGKLRKVLRLPKNLHINKHTSLVLLNTCDLRHNRRNSP